MNEYERTVLKDLENCPVCDSPPKIGETPFNNEVMWLECSSEYCSYGTVYGYSIDTVRENWINKKKDKWS